MSEYILYHYPICPFCRKVRFLLNDFGVSYKMQEVKFWKRDEFLLKLNPASEVPILLNRKDDTIFVDSFIISEYLITIYNKEADLLTTSYLSDNEVEKAEIRRIEMWFDKKFYNEVSKYILEEKVYNTLSSIEPIEINVKRLKAGQKNLDGHIKYIEFLLEKRDYLAGGFFSLADITAATHLSSLDYLGEINWSKYPRAKEWYVAIKSKLAFRNILEDKIVGFTPSKHYSALDFNN